MPSINYKPAAEVLATRPSRSGCLVIMGDHPAGSADLLADKACPHSYDMMAVNNASRGRPWKWLATLHATECGAHQNFPASNVNSSTHVIGLTTGCESARVDETLMIAPAGGTSGLFAAVVARWLGYETSRMYGVYLEEGSPYYDENVRRNWLEWWPLLSDSLTIVAPTWLGEIGNENPTHQSTR